MIKYQKSFLKEIKIFLFNFIKFNKNDKTLSKK